MLIINNKTKMHNNDTRLTLYDTLVVETLKLPSNNYNSTLFQLLESVKNENLYLTKYIVENYEKDIIQIPQLNIENILFKIITIDFKKCTICDSCHANSEQMYHEINSDLKWHIFSMVYAIYKNSNKCKFKSCGINNSIVKNKFILDLSYGYYLEILIIFIVDYLREHNILPNIRHSGRTIALFSNYIKPKNVSNLNNIGCEFTGEIKKMILVV